MKYEIMLKMVFMLLSRSRVTATEFAQRFSICRRSVMRYLTAIELAGVPLYVNYGCNGGYSVADTYKIPTSFFSVKEYDSMLAALIAVESEVPSNELKTVIDKLKSSSRRENEGAILSSDSLIIDSSPWCNTAEYKNILLLLERTVADRNIIEIIYQDRVGATTKRKVEPHTLIFKQGVWYLYGYCHTRSEFRLFKVMRISSATVTDSVFTRRAIDGICSALNFSVAQDLIDVEFEVDESISEEIEEWLGVGNVIRKNGKIYAQAKADNGRGFISKIMGFDGKLKVIKPNGLKEKIKKTCENMLQSLV